jgi:hypothetical protein
MYMFFMYVLLYNGRGHLASLFHDVFYVSFSS